MLFTAQLDVNVVAHEADDEVNLMLDLVAPSAPEAAENRVGTSLQVVLDRSGSMAGEPLQGAVQALSDLVGRLDARDNFGVVVFDDTAAVAVPAGPVIDKSSVLGRLAAIRSGGTTDLSGGYLRGLQEVRRVVGGGGGTLLMISDGHANAGITDPDRLGGLASKAAADGIVTTTLGYGLGYDEALLAAMARGGSGSHHFAQDPDAAGALIASEVDNLLAKTVQAVSLTVRFLAARGAAPAVQTTYRPPSSVVTAR
jgi:Ca-activated chloride channel family protein